MQREITPCFPRTRSSILQISVALGLPGVGILQFVVIF
jgi:hypothetical protein